MNLSTFTYPGPVIQALWLGWVISWIAAAAWTNRTENQPPAGTALRYRPALIIGTVLMFLPAHGYEGALRLWHVGLDGAWICAALIALGIAFAWWARIYLGRLWSGSVTRKADHHVVDTGPYALVRHPIYTGLLLALLATAVVKGTVLGVVAFAFLLLGIILKARIEERWLVEQLEPGAYAGYRKRVPMLVPGWPVSR